MSSFEDIEVSIANMDPIPLEPGVKFDKSIEQKSRIINEEFEKQLKCDIDEIQKEYEVDVKIHQMCNDINHDFALIDQQIKYRNELKLQYIKQFFDNLPEFISVKQLAKIYYTVYTYEYIDNLIEYDNILRMYHKECEINRLHMSEQTKRNFQKRVEEYLDRCKIKKKILVLESPVDLCIELDMTNNEISLYYYKSYEMHNKMMLQMQYIDVNVKNYVSNIHITYSLIHIIWFKNMTTLDIIEQTIDFYSSNTEYQDGKKFEKKHIQWLINNFSIIIKQLKQIYIRYKL